MDEQYQAYLVRFTRSGDHSQWRVTLQNAHNNELHHFVSEKELFLFLMERLALPADQIATERKQYKR